MTTPTDAAARKAMPIARGVLDYFPDALLCIAEVSRVGNEQHNPGEPMHWAKEKSTDEADALLRHLIDRGTFDSDGLRHSAKVAWRALALLQRELDAEAEAARNEPVGASEGLVRAEPWGEGDGPVYGMDREEWRLYGRISNGGELGVTTEVEARACNCAGPKAGINLHAAGCPLAEAKPFA